MNFVSCFSSLWFASDHTDFHFVLCFFQFVICLCLYDGFLTMVDLHHSALLADLAVSADVRTRLNSYCSVFSALGSLSVFLSYMMWDRESLLTFQVKSKCKETRRPFSRRPTARFPRLPILNIFRMCVWGGEQVWTGPHMGRESCCLPGEGRIFKWIREQVHLGSHGTTLWTDRITDTTKDITFPQPRWLAVKLFGIH